MYCTSGCQKGKKKKTVLARALKPNNNVIIIMTLIFCSAQKTAPSQAEEANDSQETKH